MFEPKAWLNPQPCRSFVVNMLMLRDKIILVFVFLQLYTIATKPEKKYLYFKHLQRKF